VRAAAREAAQEQRELGGGGASLKPLQGALGDAGLFGQLCLAEVPLQAQAGDALPQLLEEGFVAHQALDGHGTKSTMLSPMTDCAW
jgi:hypothetical protein